MYIPFNLNSVSLHYQVKQSSCFYVNDNEMLKFLHSNINNEVVFFTYLTNSLEQNPVDFSVLGMIQQRVYQAEMRDINDLKHFTKADPRRQD